MEICVDSIHSAKNAQLGGMYNKKCSFCYGVINKPGRLVGLVGGGILFFYTLEQKKPHQASSGHDPSFHCRLRSRAPVRCEMSYF